MYIIHIQWLYIVHIQVQDMTEDGRMDLVKAERLRAKAEAFELYRKDWGTGSGTMGHSF